MSTDKVITLVAFGFYMAVMILIGIFYSRKTKNNEDYFLGGRNLGGWTAALSAQASDMSGWIVIWSLQALVRGAINAFQIIRKKSSLT